MENHAFTLLISRLDRVDEKLDQIDSRMDDLIKFKWKLMGMATAVGFIGSLIMNVLMRVM